MVPHPGYPEAARFRGAEGLGTRALARRLPTALDLILVAVPSPVNRWEGAAGLITLYGRNTLVTRRYSLTPGLMRALPEGGRMAESFFGGMLRERCELFFHAIS